MAHYASRGKVSVNLPPYVRFLTPDAPQMSVRESRRLYCRPKTALVCSSTPFRYAYAQFTCPCTTSTYHSAYGLSSWGAPHTRGLQMNDTILPSTYFSPGVRLLKRKHSHTRHVGKGDGRNPKRTHIQVRSTVQPLVFWFCCCYCTASIWRVAQTPPMTLGHRV